MKYRNASILLPQDMLACTRSAPPRRIGVAEKVGSLEGGQVRDFLLVDPTQPDTGPVYDPYATLVFVCNNARGHGFRRRRAGREARPAAEVLTRRSWPATRGPGRPR